MTILVITTVLTVVLMVIVVMRYYYKLELMKSQKTLKYNGNFFYKLMKSGNLLSLLIEMVIIFVHPNIFCVNVIIYEL